MEYLVTVAHNLLSQINASAYQLTIGTIDT